MAGEFGVEVSGQAKQGRLSFNDATGNLSGAWMADQAVSGEAGVLLHIYVDRIDDTVERIGEWGGVIVQPPYPEGNVLVATFRDPAGNLVGIWQAEA